MTKFDGFILINFLKRPFLPLNPLLTAIIFFQTAILQFYILLQTLIMLKLSLKLLVLCFFSSFPLFAQQTDSVKADSVQKLDEIVIRAFEYGRPISKVPAAVGLVDKKDLERYNTTSLLPAINSIPGVRMEERSPGSYRLSIRGSTLRSPFGVRNVKIYWNELPFTDPGGNTYLNLIDPTMIQQAEVIKGPGASLYGAGTGGVVILKGIRPDFNTRQLNVSQTYGSFGLYRFNIDLETSNENSSSAIQYAHQQSDGYRDHSSMRRDVFFLNEKFNINSKRAISVNMLFADLYYQTPGGLNKSEYDKNPRSARPTVGANLGAEDQKAAIYNKTVYMSLSHEYQLSAKWSNRTGIYGTFTKFENPTIRTTEYERKTEQSVGGRTVTQYKAENIKINFGGEYQYGFTPSRTYQNLKGATGALQTDTETITQSGFVFSQIDLTLPGDFFLTAGASCNLNKVKYTNFITSPIDQQSRNFSSVITPRVALMKNIFSSVAIYGIFSQGYSPPTKDEIYPSNKYFNKTLNAERGDNYELGLKGSINKGTINYSVSSYLFQVNNTIVTRKDTLNQGAEYFINAGKTVQKGLEVAIAWTPFLSSSHVKYFKSWISYTLNHYRFHNYSKDGINYSGNKLTGTPSTMMTVGVDITAVNGLYTNLTFNYTDKISLNDANTTFANGYALLGGRIGYRSKIVKHYPVDVFGGVDNALNKKYSLGNDLNAAGTPPRFYNAAPTINFYIGLTVKLIFKKIN